MPAFPGSKGDYVAITIQGYLTYNEGGGIGITNDLKVAETGEFDRDQGEFYFDLPEQMVTSVEPAHRWANGTVVRAVYVHPDTMQMKTQIAEYVHTKTQGSYWVDPNSRLALVIHPNAKITPLWDHEGNYS